MMSEVLKNIVPAIIALIGTIIVALIGYRQWKRGQDTARVAEFRSEKQKAYKELWERIESIHVRLRTQSVDTPEFRSLVVDVNCYALKHELFLEKDLQRLINEYLNKLRDFTTVVASCKSYEAVDAVSKTASIPPEITKSLPVLAKLQSEVDVIRDEILLRCRKALTEGLSTM